jgi:glycine hydroxymethyltransferase
MNDPFPYCDIVTSTTHKSLRGPRSGIIFCRRQYEDAINFAVFPSLQGGPHNNQIAALATQLKQVATEEFKVYSRQIVANARALAAALIEKGEKVLTDGTDSHMVMWDLRPHDLTGSKVEKVLEACSMTVNKNSLVGDKS